MTEDLRALRRKFLDDELFDRVQEGKDKFIHFLSHDTVLLEGGLVLNIKTGKKTSLPVEILSLERSILLIFHDHNKVTKYVTPRNMIHHPNAKLKYLFCCTPIGDFVLLDAENLAVIRTYENPNAAFHSEPTLFYSRNLEEEIVFQLYPVYSVLNLSTGEIKDMDNPMIGSDNVIKETSGLEDAHSTRYPQMRLIGLKGDVWQRTRDTLYRDSDHTKMRQLFLNVNGNALKKEEVDRKESQHYQNPLALGDNWFFVGNKKGKTGLYSFDEDRVYPRHQRDAGRSFGPKEIDIVYNEVKYVWGFAILMGGDDNEERIAIGTRGGRKGVVIHLKDGETLNPFRSREEKIRLGCFVSSSSPLDLPAPLIREIADYL